MDIIEKYKKNALIISLSKLDLDLNSKYIEPNLQLIEDIAWEFRAQLDDIVLGKETTNKSWTSVHNTYNLHSAENLIRSYPIGGCYPISQAFLEYIETSADFTFLSKYLKEGGIIKIVWGNVRNECFQTAVQIGNYIFDVANDTVDINKPKINITKVGEGSFKNFTSIEEFILIKEKYHNTVVYVNDVVPEIAQFLPLFSKKKNIRLMINYLFPHLTFELNCKLPTGTNQISNEDILKIKAFFTPAIINKINVITDLNEKQKEIEKIGKLFNKYSTSSTSQKAE